tara:strand:- start:1256 stop:1660 length:405 start_codon:yes stop_codon:yes gene_type:complete
MYKKISRDLLKYSALSGLILGFLFCLVVFFFSSELSLNGDIQKNITMRGTIFWWAMFCLFPIISTWFFRTRVQFLDYRSAFSISCLTLLIGTVLYAILVDVYNIRDFSLQDYLISLPIPMSYSFLLATLLKKQN